MVEARRTCARDGERYRPGAFFVAVGRNDIFDFRYEDFGPGQTTQAHPGACCGLTG